MFSRSAIPYYFHTRNGHHQHRRFGKPDSRRNIPAAFFGLVVTGLYAITMAEPNWFQLKGGICSGKHLGLYTIFGVNVEKLKGVCITDAIVLKLRICAVISLCGVASSMFQFALDVCGTNKSCLRHIRKNSVGNVLSVLYAVAIIGLCYWITLDVSSLTVKTPYGSKAVECTFDIAFYLVIGAGVTALIATTLNLMKITCERRSTRHRNHEGSDMQLQLIYDYADELALDPPPEIPPAAPPVYQL